MTNNTGSTSARSCIFAVMVDVSQIEITIHIFRTSAVIMFFPLPFRSLYRIAFVFFSKGKRTTRKHQQTSLNITRNMIVCRERTPIEPISV